MAKRACLAGLAAVLVLICGTAHAARQVKVSDLPKGVALDNGKLVVTVEKGAVGAVVTTKAKEAAVPVIFQVGDILELPSRPSYDIILCRGVLNDIIDDPGHQQVFFSFARALRKGGILILDVREWTKSVSQKGREPVFERAIEIDGGTLTFRAVTRLEYETKRLLVVESHILERVDAPKTIAEYDFVMQCWTRDELHNNLISAGFGSIAYFGDYRSSSPVGSTDRIVAVASLERQMGDP